MNSKSTQQLIPIGSVIVSGSTGFRAFISPDSKLEPGTVGFQIYEKLEAIFHDTDVNRETYDKIVRVFDCLGVSSREEIQVLAQKKRKKAQIFILLNAKEEPIKLVDIRFDSPITSQFPNYREKVSDDIPHQRYANLELEALLDGLLVGDELFIGRKNRSKYLSTIDTISRQHLEVHRVGINQFMLKDMGSRNGSEIEENGVWIPLKKAIRVQVGTRIRLGGHTSEMVAVLPSEVHPALAIQRGLARLIGAMGPNDGSIIGSENDSLGLDYIDGMPPKLLRISCEKHAEYILEPLSLDTPISFLAYGGESGWQNLNQAALLTAGAVVKIGEGDNFVRMPIPTALHSLIIALTPYNEIEIGRSTKDVDLSTFQAMSRDQATLFRLPDNSVVVEDSESTNGTYFREDHGDWKEVTVPTRVRSGGEILFGSEAEGLVMVVP
jgi:pSer/pThr/pTyr-binding forkhead associated (FHA) protein